MRVIFIDEVHSILQEDLENVGYSCDLNYESTRAELLSIIGNYDGLVIRSKTPVDKEFLDTATNLKFIARSGAGLENIDLVYAEGKGVVCFNAPEGNKDAVGEHALGMLLSLFNNLVKGDQEVRNGEWDREGNRGIELGGKTVGIIGYGNNGSAFAQKLSGFGVTILAYDKYKSGFSNESVKESSLEELFEKADVLSFHIPQNEETIFMADEAFFEKFKKPIYLINLSRGKIVKTDALVEALETGKVKGACLDVLEYEKASFENLFEPGHHAPRAFDYLLHSPKVILSPHVGGWSVESYYKLSKVLADKILFKFNNS